MKLRDFRVKETAVRDRPKDTTLPAFPPRKPHSARRFTFKAWRTPWRRAYYACGRCNTAFLGPSNNRCLCPVLSPSELQSMRRV